MERQITERERATAKERGQWTEREGFREMGEKNRWMKVCTERDRSRGRHKEVKTEEKRAKE